MEMLKLMDAKLKAQGERTYFVRFLQRAARALCCGVGWSGMVYCFVLCCVAPVPTCLVLIDLLLCLPTDLKAVDAQVVAIRAGEYGDRVDVVLAQPSWY